MTKRQVVIVNPLGLHARAAAQIVTICRRFRSRVIVSVNGRGADGRHMIALLTLSAAMGAQVSIEAVGPDEEQAITAVTRFLGDGCGER